MSEMQPPSEGQPTSPAASPQVPPPPAPPQAPQPPVPPYGSQPVPPYATPAGPPEGKPRKKIVWWALILGFVTPAVGTALSWWIVSTPLAAVSALVGWGSIAAVVVAFIVGLTKPDDILRSFGVGGIVSIGVGVLITLLLFGACLVSIAGLSLPSPSGD